MRGNYGQEFWWKPGEPAPDRALDVGKAIGVECGSQGFNLSLGSLLRLRLISYRQR
jgi:hypothetical protein